MSKLISKNRIAPIIVLMSILFTFPGNPIFAAYDEFQVSQEVTGAVCGNGVCETGETYENCPADCEAPTPPTPPGGGGVLPDVIPPTIYNLSISNITTTSARVSWETDEQAVCQFLWGETSEYEEGIIFENAFFREHSTELSGLVPETLYHFKIICRDTNRNESQTSDQQFSTLAPPDITPPPNVNNFEATEGDQQIELEWINPDDPDFKGVRILRSDKFFPLDPWNGALVYEGAGESVLDTGLANNIRYYYTAFSYDDAGNFSSGAIVSAIPRKPGIPPEEEPTPIFPPEIPEVPPEEIPPELKDLLDELSIYDFEFWQHGKQLEVVNGKVTAKPEGPIQVLLRYEKIPEVLKTIAINFLRNDGKSFAFLLRVDQGKTIFTATLFPPDPQEYDMKIQVLDYKNQRLKRIDGSLEIESFPPVSPLTFWQKIVKYSRLYLIYAICVLLPLFLLWLLLLLLRRRKDEDDDENSPNSSNLNDTS